MNSSLVVHVNEEVLVSSLNENVLERICQEELDGLELSLVYIMSLALPAPDPLSLPLPRDTWKKSCELRAPPQPTSASSEFIADVGCGGTIGRLKISRYVSVCHFFRSRTLW